MKRKVLLTIIPALMALSSCAGANLKAKENLFVEDTLAHEELFANGSSLGIRKLAPIDASGPSIGFQTAEAGGNISIRFVAAVKLTGSLDSTTAVWTRTMYEDDGDVFKVATAKASSKAYTSITENSEELTISDYNEARGGTDYTHFVVYTMRNIPKSTYGNYFLNASLSINGGEAAKVVATSVNQKKQLSFAPSQEGYFLNGTLGGVANSSLASISPSGDDVARFSGALAANDKFFVCYNHVDATPANSKFKVYDSSCLSDGLSGNPFLVDDGTDAKMIKAVSGHNYAFNFNNSYELDDLFSGYTVTYRNESNVETTASLIYDGVDGSSKPQFNARIAAKSESPLSFKLDGNAISVSGEYSANVNGSLEVIYGGPDVDLYLKDQGGSYTLWATEPAAVYSLYLDGVLDDATDVNPGGWGVKALYEVYLTSGTVASVKWGYTEFTADAVTEDSYYWVRFNDDLTVTTVNRVSNYYLVGKINKVTDWDHVSSHRFINTTTSNEYKLLEPITLASGDEFKVVNAADTSDKPSWTWYPGGSNCTIDSDGNYDVYFRPNYDGGLGWHESCIYVNKIVLP